MATEQKDPALYRLGSNVINAAKDAYAYSDKIGKNSIKMLGNTASQLKNTYINGVKQLGTDVSRPIVSRSTQKKVEDVLTPNKKAQKVLLGQQQTNTNPVKSALGNNTVKNPTQKPQGLGNTLSTNAYSADAKQKRNDLYNQNAVDNGDGTTSVNVLGGSFSGSNRGMRNMLNGHAKNNRYSLEYLNEIAKQGGSFSDQYDGTTLVKDGKVINNPYGYTADSSSQQNSLNYAQSLGDNSRTAISGAGSSDINMLDTRQQVNNIRDNSQQQITQAVKSGNITANEATNLLPRAKLGTDYVSPYQRAAALDERKVNAEIGLTNAQADKARNRKTGKPAFTMDSLNQLLPMDTSPEIKQRLSTIDGGFWRDVNKDIANAGSQSEVDNIITQLMQSSGIGDPRIFNSLLFQSGY